MKGKVNILKGIIFMYFFLLAGCNDTSKINNSDKAKIGVQLDCTQSGWLDELPIRRWPSEQPATQSQTDSKAMNWKPPTFVIAGLEGYIPVKIAVGGLYNIKLTKQNEGVGKWTSLDMSTIKNLGYDGEYGGFVSFNPVADGLYRIYSDKKLWFNLMHAYKNIFASRYINCFEKEHESIQLVVEFYLKGEQDYTLHFLNAEEDSFNMLILGAQ